VSAGMLLRPPDGVKLEVCIRHAKMPVREPPGNRFLTHHLDVKPCRIMA
jgi:hypothetical protein